MENSRKKSGGVEIPKRSRSLDLKSLYKSRVPQVGEKVSKEDVKKKKRKSRKEVSLSRFEPDAKKSRKEGKDGGERQKSMKEDGNGGECQKGMKEGENGGERLKSRNEGDNGAERKKSMKEGENGRERQMSKKEVKSGGERQKSRKEDKNGGERQKSRKEDKNGGERQKSMKEEKNGAERQKSRKEDENGGERQKSTMEDNKGGEKGFDMESSGGSKGLHGISLTLSASGAFNFPKRPRGTVGRRKLESDKVSQPRGNLDSDDRGKAINETVIKSDDKADLLVTLISFPAGTESISNSKSAGEVSGPNSKLKKAASKPKSIASSSSKKLKRKAGEDEIVESGRPKPKDEVKESGRPKPKDDVKKSGNSRSGTVGQADKEDGIAVNNGDKSSKNRRSYIRKKKKELVDRKDGHEAAAKKAEPSVGSSVADSIFVDFLDDDDDDDEENLEQNAARMLSSRFDPSCTGFSSKRKSSISETANGLSFPVSVRDFQNRKANTHSGIESASADDASRFLRPRTEEKGKGPSRKRRHYYEIFPTDLDAYWVLNRRIKVFWPLDDCWYDGLLNDYNPETKLHHIKYDDREEEWVNLEQEKFKLLLLPSEVPENSKPKRQRNRKKNVQEVKKVPPSDDNSCIANDIDSQPIATWLGRSSQRFKFLPRPLKKQRTMHVGKASSMSSEKIDNSCSNMSDSNVAGTNRDSESALADDSCQKEVDDSLGATASSQSIRGIVYVRKKHSKRSVVTSFSECGKIRLNIPDPGLITPLASAAIGFSGAKVDKINYELVDSEQQFWSIDSRGELRLNVRLMSSKGLRFRVCLPGFPYLEFSRGTRHIGLLHDILMLQHGLLVATSPAVCLEILFIDNHHGLRFLLFEGCMNQALAFVFLILVAFSQPDEEQNFDIQLPVTSIKFRLSGALDLRKHHVFAFYCFSRLQSSKWLFLDSKLMQHCRLIKQLPVSECTYDNIKDLEHGNNQQRRTHVGLDLSSSEGCKRGLVPGILPMGIMREASNRRMGRSTFTLAAKPGRVPHFALSFSAAPTFFLSLHFQLLLEHSYAWVHLQHQDRLCPPESAENSSQFRPTPPIIQDLAAQPGLGMLTTGTSALPSSEHEFGADGDLTTNAVKNVYSSGKLQIEDPNGAADTSCVKELNDKMLEAQSDQPESIKEVHVSSTSPLRTSIPPASSPRGDSGSDGMILDIPSVEQVGSRRLSKRGRSRSTSLGDLSPVWPDGKTNFLHMGLSNGPKKPRTQVQYTLPFAGNDSSAKQKVQNQRALPCKRIRKASLKKLSDGSRSNQRNLDVLACGVNVLVTHGDKGWREYGAHVVLEVADHNEWRLAVKLSGITKYSYKVKHILQPGSTNRFSHAMMWKGGKDWVLEFPDRSQWTLFKELHEECYNRNIRAASVKNIPIPGVQLIEENDDYGTEVPFVRNPIKYLRQVQTDVEMALDPSHILYDLDSDDEEWLRENKKGTAKVGFEEITEELLEKTIDMFEKVSYIQHRDNFTDAEVEELVVGLRSVEGAKVIYDHWRQKRERKGMPLIRHLQPPLWERYQQQLKEWEKKVPRGNGAISIGSQEKVTPPEKPPMFAFCLKPRGLELPNKGSKQRGQRKFQVSLHHHAGSADSDSVVLGRRMNGHAIGDERFLCDYSDFSPGAHASMRAFSPRDAHFSLSSDPYEWSRDPKYKSKSKKHSSYSLNNQQMISYNQRTIVNRNGVQHWNMGLPEYSRQRPYYFEGHHRQGLEQLDGSELDEFRLRDATSAAKHARTVAKLKRERAQRLLYRADLCVHKAVVALMTAEAMKAAHESPKGDN